MKRPTLLYLKIGHDICAGVYIVCVVSDGDKDL